MRGAAAIMVEAAWPQFNSKASSDTWSNEASASTAPRLVVHFTDGRLVKGVSPDFGHDPKSFTLRPLGKPDPLRVWLKELKAVFFVKYYDGRPFYRPRPSSHLRVVESTDESRFREQVRVRFRDGETLVGFCSSDAIDAAVGFYVVPMDRSSNNFAVYVIRGSALESVDVTPLPPPIPPPPPPR